MASVGGRRDSMRKFAAEAVKRPAKFTTRSPGDIPPKAPRDASISPGMPLPVRSAHATVSPLNITGNEALEFPMMTNLELGELVNFSVASIPFHWRSEGVIPSVTIR